MCQTTQLQDFWWSITHRCGWDVFYDPKYWKGEDSTGLPLETVFPWWAPITRFVTKWFSRVYWIYHTLNLRSGWCRWDDNQGLNARLVHRPELGPRWKDQWITEPVWKWMRRKFFKRVWYTLKIVLCILFCYERHPDEEIHGKWFHDYIEVAAFDFAPYTSMEWSGDHSCWTSIEVGSGVFKNWFFREYQDSSI